MNWNAISQELEDALSRFLSSLIGSKLYLRDKQPIQKERKMTEQGPLQINLLASRARRKDVVPGEVPIHRPVPLIGLDIGTSSIKLAEVQHEPDGTRVITKFDLIELAEPISFWGFDDPKEEIAAVCQRNREVLTSALQELVKRNGILGRKVAIAAPCYSSSVKIIDLPLMSEDDFAGSIAWEAEPYFPFHLDEGYFDAQVVCRKQDGMQALLAVARRDVVDDYLWAVQQASLEPVVVETEHTALFNLVLQSCPCTMNPVALVNIGAEITSVLIFGNGQLLFTRDISQAGNVFTKVIQKQFSIGRARAEKRKRKYKQKKSISLKLRSAANFFAQIISDQVIRSLVFFHASHVGPSISMLYITGGSAMHPYVCAQFAQELEKCNLPEHVSDFGVMILNPLAGFEIDMPSGQDILSDTGNEYRSAVALGLALRQG